MARMHATSIRRLTSALLWGCFVFWTSQLYAADPDEPVVIVNARVKEQSVSVETLRTIFGMRLRNWQDGTPIRVFVLQDDNPLHGIFTKKVLGMFPHQLRWAWGRLVFSGTGQAPWQMTTEEDMRARVAETPGAIGYLRRSQVDDSVQVLRVSH